jgi:epoxyqueuosine reductase
MLSPAAIKQRAAGLGFNLCGIAAAESFSELQFLSEWLDRGYAGEMVYMEKSAHTRADIRNFLPSARSVIVTGTIYNTDAGAAGATGATSARGPDAIKVARYARGADYHVVLPERLEALVAWMREQSSEPFEAAIFCDKHHVQERVYAQHAGIGWIGKNSCVISPELGSWMFLSGIAVSLALAPDQPALDRCGSCTLCIDACPTGALVDAHELDATKCISYLTIETHHEIPEGQRAMVGGHVWGCDICQDVCPFNLGSPVTSDEVWHAPGRHGLSAAALWEETDDEIHERIKGSAMTFVPLSRLRRNLAIAIGNSGNRDLLPALQQPGRGKKNAARSALTPAVADAVEWATARLSAEK